MSVSNVADSPYTIAGELLIVGKKSIVCRCPRTLRRLIEADVQYAPVADYRSVVKEEKDKTNTITLFDIRLKDRLYASGPGELPKTYEVVFELPLEFNPYVTEGTYGPEIDVQNTMTASYFEELNALLQCWAGAMKQKLSAENVTFYTPSTWRLKYPWKKVTVGEYFEKFNPETYRHKVNVGLGYHNLKDAKMGISLQLSQYPSTPPKPTKKRKVELLPHTSSGDEREEEEEEVDPTSRSRPPRKPAAPKEDV